MSHFHFARWVAMVLIQRPSFVFIFLPQVSTNIPVLIPVVVEAMKEYLHKAEEESAAIQKNADEMIAKINYRPLLKKSL